MLTFLFWNLNRKSLDTSIASIALKHEIDVFMFTELTTDPAKLLACLNEKNTEYFYVPKLGCEKIELFTRFPAKYINPVFETDRLTIRRLALPGLMEILVAIIHFPSKMFWTDSSQAAECTLLSNRIQNQEETVGHARTIVVGDFNMNPFEDGMVNAIGLNSVMCQDIARRERRTVQGVTYPFFYNPMWNFFGDALSRPFGTYYYERSEHKAYFWNIFDQVLVRPALLDRFHLQSLTILNHDGINSLVAEQGIPDCKKSSDHLPISFQLSL
jgi:hypothetical protein